MVTLQVGGRELALSFTMSALCAMEIAFGENARLTKDSLNEILSSHRDTMKLLEILANAALEADGQPEDVTAKWLGAHLRPAQTAEIQVAILEAISEGMKMEADEDDPDKEVDVVLEQIKKKDKEA